MYTRCLYLNGLTTLKASYTYINIYCLWKIEARENSIIIKNWSEYLIYERICWSLKNTIFQRLIHKYTLY